MDRWTAVLASVMAAAGCARHERAPATTTNAAVSDASVSNAPTLTSASAPAPDGLDPATRAAAEHAIVPDVRGARVVPPPLPRTAAAPSPPPTATPGTPTTAVPITPKGRTEPVPMPADLPPGVPPASSSEKRR